jgi:hypothetical protein
MVWNSEFARSEPFRESSRQLSIILARHFEKQKHSEVL